MTSPVFSEPAGATPASTSSEPSAPAPAEAPAESDWPVDLSTGFRGTGDDDEDGDRSFSAADTPTLREHLYTQLSLTNLGPRDRAFVQLLIDALDEDGYLTQPLEEIAALLETQAPAQFADDAEASLEELSIALRHLDRKSVV